MRGQGSDFGAANKHDQGRVSYDPTGTRQAPSAGASPFDHSGTRSRGEADLIFNLLSIGRLVPISYLQSEHLIASLLPSVNLGALVKRGGA